MTSRQENTEIDRQSYKMPDRPDMLLARLALLLFSEQKLPKQIRVNRNIGSDRQTDQSPARTYRDRQVKTDICSHACLLVDRLNSNGQVHKMSSRCA